MEQDKMTTANEPMAAYGTNSYTDVMMMLYTMPMSKEVKRHVGLRLVEETNSGSFIAEAFDRINHLASLNDGWAGDGSYAISRRVLDNLRKVLLISNDEDWKNWTISPDVNATICLYSPVTKASISIGADEFSYFARIDGHRFGDSHVTYTPQSFLQIMRRLG